MRTSRALIAVVFVLSALSARAQTPSSPASAWSGSINFGAVGTSLDGDGARYQRYRDLRDGPFIEAARANRTTSSWIVDLQADHVGRRDQRYAGAAERVGKVKTWFMWDQIPMLLSNTTRTLYSGIGTGELRIDDALQARAQATPATMNSIFAANSVEFDTRTRRHIAEGGFEYRATQALTFTANVRHTQREGTIPYGGSFGHSRPVEFPLPTDHRLTNADAGAEFSRGRVLLRAGYTGSFFTNNVLSVVFDNPFRVTDISTASSAGRSSLAPSSTFMGVNGMASVRLPYRSRATAYVSVGTLNDAGDPLMPQTVNTAVTSLPLARTTVEGQARTTGAHLSFVSRPTRNVDVTAAFRQYDFDNRTPEFAMRQRVAYDNAPSTVNPAIDAEQFSVLRQTFDADLRLSGGGVTGGIGFTRYGEERTHRIFESTADNVLRLTFDAVNTRWYSVRTKYEHSRKRGEGIEEGEAELIAIGEHPEIRHFDIASRDRDRVTILGSVSPANAVSLNASVAAGKDDYLESIFGLRDNTHRVYGIGFDATPTDRVVLSTNYAFERYNALNRSRQATAAQFNDASRNWAADSTDRTHTVTLGADFLRIADKVDLKLAYDFSRARAVYEYITGPVANRTLPEEVTVPTTLPTPKQFPPTLNELQRGTVDLSYAVRANWSIGIAYWREQYKVDDFTLDAEAIPELAGSAAVLLGYMYRPYTANTVWGRLNYRW